jgi:hypothetical protein
MGSAKNKNGQKGKIQFVQCCDLDWIRTNGPHLRRMTLYPAELPDLYFEGQK